MQLTIALILVAVYVAAFAPLRRLIRSPERPSWLRNPLNVEYVLLTHMAVLLTAACLFVDALLR